MPEAELGQVRGHGFSFQSVVDVGFGFCGRDVAKGLEQTAVVEPIHPLEGRVFNGLEVAPRSAAVDDLRLEQPVDRPGKRVVIAVAHAADRGLDAYLSQAFSVFDRQILTRSLW